MLQKISISNKYCSFELYIHERQKSISVSTKILISTTGFSIDNDQKCFLSSIRMISEGSCDAEDWRNAKALHHRNK